MLLLSYSQLILLNLILLGAVLLHGLAMDISHALEAMHEKTSQLKAASTIGSAENNKMNLSKCDYDKGDFKKIIISATKAMDFFEKHINELVIDAAIGTRIIEAQLALLQAGHPHLPAAVQMYLMTLQFKSELLSDEILVKFVEVLSTGQLSKESHKNLKEQIPWVINVSLWESPQVGGWKSADILKAFSLKSIETTTMDRKTEVLGEELSDKCIGELFTSCVITDECSQLFMQKPHSLYSLTHQVIFFLIANKHGCLVDPDFKAKTFEQDPGKFIDHLCGQAWLEANSIEASGYPIEFRDLLAEQVTVCAAAGYPNFLKRVWLEKLLSWQSADDSLGCFVELNNDEEVSDTDNNQSTVILPKPNDVEGKGKGKVPVPAERSYAWSDDDSLNYENIQEDKFYESQPESQKRWGNYDGYQYQYHSQNQVQSQRQRVKRSDEIVKIGQEKCSIHFTAVCLGSLAMHLRYFADTCLSTY